MKKKIYILGTLCAIVFACKYEPVSTEIDSQLETTINLRSKTGNLDYFILPDETDFSKIPNQDPKNPITAEKVALGKMLFHETGIGLTPSKTFSYQTYSCSSCHIAKNGFTAGRHQGIADGAIGFGDHGEGRDKNPYYKGSEVDAQGARPLPTMNLAYVTNALWAGTFGSRGVNEGTESVWNQDTLVNINHQQLEGLEANNIRALIVHRQMMNKKIADALGYTEMFDKAFPDFPESERYSLKTSAFAIAAYFRTIFTNQAPFQKWLKGDKKALTASQKQGAMLFFGKAGCINCHNSPSFNQMDFFAVGAKDMYQNEKPTFRTDEFDNRNNGRGGFTKRTEDLHKFKVPQLYSLKNVGFYLHGGSKKSLREVVEYFNAAVGENPNVPKENLATFFRPLNLTEEEKQQLTDFLENGLFDANMERYIPSRTMSGKCFPNNDDKSKADMGCF